MWLSLALSAALFLAIVRYQVLLTLIVRAGSQLKLRKDPLATPPNFAVLIPAHNEEIGIAATVGSLHALDYPKSNYRIITIADNCSDQTAKVAAACGSEVFERFHETRKSKGYALEYAIERLKQEPGAKPDAIVVIDADTRVDRDMLNAIGRRINEGMDWLQVYGSVANPDDSWRTQLMTYAFALINGIWLAGQERLGLGCALRGNGMVLSWKGLQRHPWQAYGLAEDLEFSWHLRLAGERIGFVPEARIYSEIITGNEAASKAQRLRWEKGRAEAKKTFAARIDAGSDSRLRKWLFASDLNMPPLSRFAVYSYGCWFLALAACLLSRTTLQFALAGALLGAQTFFLSMFKIYLMLPFFTLGLPWRYLKALTKAPLYMAWKFVLLLSRTPATWVRTERIQKKD